MARDLGEEHPLRAALEVARRGARRLVRAAGAAAAAAAVHAAVVAALAERRGVVLVAVHRHRRRGRVAKARVAHRARVHARRGADAERRRRVRGVVPDVLLQREDAAVAVGAFERAPAALVAHALRVEGRVRTIQARRAGRDRVAGPLLEAAVAAALDGAEVDRSAGGVEPRGDVVHRARGVERVAERVERAVPQHLRRRVAAKLDRRRRLLGFQVGDDGALLRGARRGRDARRRGGGEDRVRAVLRGALRRLRARVARLDERVGHPRAAHGAHGDVRPSPRRRPVLALERRAIAGARAARVERAAEVEEVAPAGDHDVDAQRADRDDAARRFAERRAGAPARRRALRAPPRLGGEAP